MSNEINIVQNPALGAYAVWRFVHGFQKEDGSATPLPLAFLVLPLILHENTLAIISSTQKSSGLRLFAAKFSAKREDLLSLHDRALVLRGLSLQSIGMAVTSNLLKVNYAEATLLAYERELKLPTIPARLGRFASAPEKLGYWFFKAGISQVAISLGVYF